MSLLLTSLSLCVSCAWCSVGHFPVWPAKVSVLHVTWLYEEDTMTAVDTTIVGVDTGPEEKVTVDTLSYVGEASHHDIEFVDDHTILFRRAMTTSETDDPPVRHSSSCVQTSASTGYGRIEYSDGLVYEGDCCTMQPHGWVSVTTAA